jgi:small subunit ribosomal protein S3e
MPLTQHILSLPKHSSVINMSAARRSRLSTKRKFVADGVFFAELNELLTRELAEDGYAGVEVRTTPHRTEVIIRATRTQNVLGEKGQRIRELTSVVQKRFDFADGAVELYAERVQNRGLCAQAQAESLKFKLLGGLAVRRACYGVVRFVMEASAKGCEVIVSGKLRGQRAKGMKFGDGYMIKTGHAGQVYTDTAVRHVMMRQGVVGIKVVIFLPHDPKGIAGPSIPLDDVVVILEPKEEINPAAMLARQQAAAAAASLAAAQAALLAPSDDVVPAEPDMEVDPNVAAGF